MGMAGSLMSVVQVLRVCIHMNVAVNTGSSQLGVAECLLMEHQASAVPVTSLHFLVGNQVEHSFLEQPHSLKNLLRSQ